jgi:hypothetical protein
MAFSIRVSLLFGVLLLLPSLRALGDEKSELEALREEVRQERNALAAERADLAEQRRRVDDALAELEHEKAQPPPGTPTLPGVSAAVDAETRPRPWLDIYGFAILDAI